MHMEDVSAAAIHNGTPYGLRVICRQVLRAGWKTPAARRMRLFIQKPRDCELSGTAIHKATCIGKILWAACAGAHNSWPLASSRPLKPRQNLPVKRFCPNILSRALSPSTSTKPVDTR
jgi:hypothetical protein